MPQFPAVPISNHVFTVKSPFLSLFCGKILLLMGALRMNQRLLSLILLPSFVASCKIIHITLEHGLCSESVVGLSLYASVLCQRSNIYIEGATRIGKIALALLDLFNIEVPRIYYLHYGFVAGHTESPILCMEMCRKGYKGKLS